MAENAQLVATFLGGDISSFLCLAEKLLSASNEERREAERIYEECKNHPDALISRLVEVLRKSDHVELRGLCAVLLRKLITKDTVLTKLRPESLSALKTQLLEAIHLELTNSVLKKLCDTLGELAMRLLSDGTWPELLPCIYQWVSAPEDRLKECGLLLLAQLSAFIAENMTPYMSTLLSVLHDNLMSTSSSAVRIASLQASGSFIQHVEGEGKVKFQALLPGMIKVLTTELNAKDEAAAQEALEVFVDIADVDPRFMKKQLAEVVNIMLQVAESSELEEETRHLALEFVMTLVEARDQAPGMMRKLPSMIGRTFALLLNMLVNIEDSPEWYTAANESDNFVSEDFDFANECLDRLSMSLQGNTIVPLASQLFSTFLPDADWKKRHAALYALGQIAEGCSKVMLKNLDSVVNMSLSSFRDPHPRVRYAAINSFAQLCIDLVPDLQGKYHHVAMPALIFAISESGIPRIQAHAVNAILNYADGAPEESMNPYMDALVSKLLSLLQTTGLSVQEATVTALASIADNAQEQFLKYYDVVMPYLKMILMSEGDKERRMLRAKCVECITLVGMSVGKEKFGPDAKEVIDLLLRIQNTKLDDDDPMANYISQAWARLCKCLGKEFLPLMPQVMPLLLHSAKLTPSFEAIDSDDEDDKEGDEDYEVFNFGTKKMAIRTSLLEEKANAVNILCIYVEELKEEFFPWVDEVSQIVVPLLTYGMNSEVKKGAIQAIPNLLVSARLALEGGKVTAETNFLNKVFQFLFPPLGKALENEEELDVIIELLESVNECVKTGFGSMDSEILKNLMVLLKKLIDESRARRKSRLDRYDGDDLDVDEKEMTDQENELEDAIYEQIGEIIGSLMKNLKVVFVPYFDEFLPTLIPLMQPAASEVERRVTICILDDAVEVYESAAVKYFEVFLPVILQTCVAESCDIRQASVYGLGVCAEFGGAAFTPAAAEALQKLSYVVSQPNSRSPENESATDNAVSAIGKICEFQSAGISNSDLVLTSWLAYLPIKKDLDEAKVVHKQFTSFLERGDARIFGQSYQNLPKILGVISDVLAGGVSVAAEDTLSHMKDILRTFQQNISQDILTAAWSRLLPHQQAALQAI